MSRKVDVETVDAVRRRLAVEVPAEEVSAELERAYADLARAAKVRGFRPGRVPRHVLDRMFGDRVRADVFTRIIQHSYAEILQEQQIEAVGPPEIITEQAKPGEALRYSVTVEVMPDVVVRDYGALEVERPLLPVSEEDVDGFIERLRQAAAQLHPLADDAAAERGHVVVIDYTAQLEGREVGRGQGREIELGAHGFPREFDEQLTGVTRGAVLDFAVTYAADHAAAELAGKTVQFHVTVRGLFRKELPALDDEFAKDHGDCSTLSELRQRGRQQLEAEAARHADDAVRRAVVERLARDADIPIPRALVERRTEALVDEVLHDWQQRRIRPQSESVARSRLRDELAPQAQQQVKIGLLLNAIARQEGITVSDADLDARIASLATQAGSASERVRAIYQDATARDQLRTRMLQSGAIDLVVGRARITTIEQRPIVAEAGENG